MIEFTPIPVGFELERFGSASIDLHEWMRLRKYALEFVVGKGVNATSFTVLHTEAGFADLASHTQVKWLADHFELLCVAADEKHRHFLDIQYDGVIHRIPFEALLPDKICATLFRIGVAVDRTFGAYEAMSMYLQAAVAALPVEDARQVLGWKDSNTLHWCGAAHSPPVLRAHLEMSPEDYLAELNRLILPMPSLQFVLCAAAASTLLAYLRITEKLPADCFGVYCPRENKKEDKPSCPLSESDHFRYRLQYDTVLLQQSPGGFHRVHAHRIFHRSEFLAAVYLKRQTAVLHVHHIQHQRFELVAIGFLRLHQLSCFVEMRDLFVCDVQREIRAQRMHQSIYAEQVV